MPLAAWRALLVLLCLLLSSSPVRGEGGGADAAFAEHALVLGVEEPALAVVDGYAFLFGGRACRAFAECEHPDLIQRFDPRTGVTTTMGARLPEPLYGAMAVAHGGSIYVLGGIGDRFLAPLDTVHRYDVATDTIETLDVTLPVGLAQASVATIGNEAYLFGGATEAGTSSDILVFDIARQTFRTAGAQLPSAHHVGAAVTDGRVAYILGGLDGVYDAEWARQEAIWRYDPRADTLEVMGARLTGPLVGIAAVWDGEGALVLGGKSIGADSSAVRRYDPAADAIVPIEYPLEPGRSHARAFWDDGMAYVLGGRIRDEASSDAVTAYGAWRPDVVPPTPTIVRDAPTAAPAWLREVHALPDLPSPRTAAAVARAGDAAYLFGGLGEDQLPMDSIVRVDLATGESREMGARLPVASASAGAFWDGQHVYVIGGIDAEGNFLGDILRYDPARDTLRAVTARLPVADAGDVRHSGTNVGWTGTHAYILGGAYAQEILRFDPARGTLTTMEAVLPQTIADPAVGWDGEAFYMFGGWLPYDDLFSDLVVRYDPAADEVRVLDTSVGQRMGAGVVHDGSAFYILGGWEPGGPRDDVLQFDPDVGMVRALDERLPASRAYAASVWTGRAALLLGGEDADGAIADAARLGPAGAGAAADADIFTRAGAETPGAGLLLALAAVAGAALALRRVRRQP